MHDNLDKRMRALFSELFLADASALDDEVRRGELMGWDSLAHLTLVARLEGEFSITIDPDLALEIETFGDAKNAVADLLGHGK